MKSARQRMLLGFIVLAAWFAAGCSRLPTEPSAEVGAASFTGAEQTKVARSPSVPSPETGPSVTIRVLGNQGGTARSGQFTVVIPSGAFSGQATITVSQPDPGKPRVDLAIWPASKNSFALPVMLIADLSRFPKSQVAGSKVGELDPASGGWTPVSGQITDVQARSVRVPLAHFSSYRIDFPTYSYSPTTPPTTPPAPQPGPSSRGF